MPDLPDRPNIVVIYADDLGFGDVGCFGGTDLATPHLDALAASGITATQWYSCSPVCSPSRAALLTGRLPVHAGVQEILGGSRGAAGLPDQPTMASVLRTHGYATGIFGKWHLGVAEDYRPLRRGFDTHFGFLAGCLDYYSHIFYWGQGMNPVHDLWRDGQEVWRNGQYLTEQIGQAACHYITAQAKAGQPFFAFVPFNAPHYPLHAPTEYLDRFGDLPPHRRIMAAMIAAMDDAIGGIMTALELAGVRQDTLVFFSSDNGPSTESRNWLNGEEVSYQGGSTGGLRGHKGSLFEGGIRVPTILSWPGHLAPGIFHRPAAMCDLLPTVLELCGIEVPAGLDGVSQLRELCEAGAAGPLTPSSAPKPLVPAGSRSALEPARDVADRLPPGRSLLWEYGPQLALRRGDFKFVISPREELGGPFVVEEMLIDLASDPGETTDISGHYPNLTAALRAELMAWAKAWGYDPSPWSGKDKS